jgi:hypothetical protein
MKYLMIICLIVATGCAHKRSPSSVNGPSVARDSIALGKIKATATKALEKSEVCFDIDLVMHGTEEASIQSSNWTLAWVDQKDQYHLVSLNQRDPASAPQDRRIAAQYGEYHEWTNSFKTCAPGARINDVKSLVLTPKNEPFGETKGLHLDWK